MIWLDRKRGVLAMAQQLDAAGVPLDGQECVADDHPDVLRLKTEPIPGKSLDQRIAELEAKLSERVK